MDSKKLYFLLFLFIFTIVIDAAQITKDKKHKQSMILRKKETNAVNFIRLTVMRVIYGVATRLGLGEQISETLNGVFVPPGVDPDYDYGDDDGIGLFNREDDDDYDY